MTTLPRATVLLMEDEPFVLMLATDVLEDEGFTVLAADDGSEAYRILAENPQIDLLVTDVNLPGLDGCTLAAQALAIRSDLRLIMTSGRHRFRNEDLPDHGEFLPKPYLPRELVALVRKKLSLD